jgi:hypothetical protein
VPASLRELVAAEKEARARARKAGVPASVELEKLWARAEKSPSGAVRFELGAMQLDRVLPGYRIVQHVDSTGRVLREEKVRITRRERLAEALALEADEE